MSRLTVFSVIRNGIVNGYPFVEAYASWLEYADRAFIFDGESTDGTDVILGELAALDSHFSFATRPWPETDLGGSSIAEFTNAALSLASEGADRVMYVQADEIYSTKQRRLVSEWEGGALEFRGCINFWNSFERVLANDFPMRYVRLIRTGDGASSIGDGFSFDPGESPLTRLNERILHYGWCFPINILQKHVNHAHLYRNEPSYLHRGRLARKMLEQRVYDRRLLDALAPHYRAVPFVGEHPECMRHLLGGAHYYDPYVGLEALAGGARW